MVISAPRLDQGRDHAKGAAERVKMHRHDATTPPLRVGNAAP